MNQKQIDKENRRDTIVTGCILVFFVALVAAIMAHGMWTVP